MHTQNTVNQAFARQALQLYQRSLSRKTDVFCFGIPQTCPAPSGQAKSPTKRQSKVESFPEWAECGRRGKVNPFSSRPFQSTSSPPNTQCHRYPNRPPRCLVRISQCNSEFMRNSWAICLSAVVLAVWWSGLAGRLKTHFSVDFPHHPGMQRRSALIIPLPRSQARNSLAQAAAEEDEDGLGSSCRHASKTLQLVGGPGLA